MFDDVALTRIGDDTWLAWSDRSGTYARRLDGHGAPREPARRVGAPCPGGVAAGAIDGALWLACLRPGDRDRDRAGTLVAYRLGAEGGFATAGSVAPVGDRSRHPTFAAHGDEGRIGWRDADVFVAHARTVPMRGGELGEPETLSSGETLASAPSATFVDGAFVHAWTESWFDRGDARGHLLVQREGSVPRPSLEINDVDVHTFLTSDERGPLISLRDQRPRGRSHRTFVGRLDEDLRLTTDALHSPTRADSEWGRPSLVSCGAQRFSVATRRSSRRVTMVTVQRLDEELAPVGDEHQIYEYHSRFPQAAAVCVDGRLLIGVGERQTQTHPTPRLRTYELICEPGREHERTPGTEGRVPGQPDR